MADLTPTAVSNSSNFVTGTGDKTNEVLTDLLANRTETYALLTSIRKQQYSASAPASPNIGDLWRCSTTAGLYVANTTYRWSGTAWVAESIDSISVTARNVVIQGEVTTAGATALFTGSTAALTVQLNASTLPAVFTWMDGNDGDVGQKNYIGAVTANSTTFWSSLPQSSTVYLYVDFDGTSTISGGFSTIAPVYQNYAPSHSSGKHWIDDNAGKCYSSDGASWTQRYRVFVGTVTTDTTKCTAQTIYDYNVLRANVTGLASLNIPLSYLDTDGTLSADSDSKVPTQKAVKTYVDGKTGTSAGQIIQVASTTKTDTFTTNSTSWVDITGMSVNITPSSSSNKVFVQFDLIGINNNTYAAIQLLRNTTPICVGASVGSRTPVSGTLYNGTDNSMILNVSNSVFDSPATTAATTYKLQGIVQGGTLCINRSNGDSDGTGTYRCASTITAMEVKG
jgi:hypothetical protein